MWTVEPLEDDPTFVTRSMFGGLAVYYDGKMVLVMMENRNDLDWNGMLIPTERPFHLSLLKEFSELIPHRILGKWLYLPLSSGDFEDHAVRLIDSIRRRDPRFGIYPKKRSSKKRRTKVS